MLVVFSYFFYSQAFPASSTNRSAQIASHLIPVLENIAMRQPQPSCQMQKRLLMKSLSESVEVLVADSLQVSAIKRPNL